MAFPNISSLPTPPSRTDDSATFVARANAFLGHFPTLQSEINTWASYANVNFTNEMNGIKTSTEVARDAALAAQTGAEEAESAILAATSYKGLWSSLTGALNKPASVSHNGDLWVLNNNLADVTASEPSSFNSDWSSISGVTLSTNQTITGAKTFTSLVEINKAGPNLRLKHNVSGVAAYPYMDFYNADGRLGFIGYGSATNNNMSITCESGNIDFLGGAKLNATDATYVSANSLLNAGAMDSRYVGVANSQTITGPKVFTNFITTPSTVYNLSTYNSWSVGKLENSNSFFISQTGDNTGVFFLYPDHSAAYAKRFEVNAGKLSAPASNYVNSDSILNAGAMDSRYVGVANEQTITGRKTFKNALTRFQGVASGTSNVVYYDFLDSTGTVQGEIGFFSSSDNIMRLRNNVGSMQLVATAITAPTAPYIDSSSILNAGAMDARYVGVVNSQTVTGAKTFSGYTKLGSDAPAIKMKKLTGTTPASGSSFSIAHGIADSSKILSVTGFYTDTGSGLHYPFGIYSKTADTDSRINLSYISSTLLVFYFFAASGATSASYRILVTYEE